MSVGDIEVIKGFGPVRRYLAEDRTTSSQSATMKAGEPVKVGGTGTNFAYLCATGDPEIGTDEMLGVVFSESTETSSADGEVYVRTLLPNTVLRGKATTATNVDTQAELDGLINDWVAFDVTAGAYTIDENEGTDPNVHGLRIVGGDVVKGKLDVVVHPNAAWAPLTGQTMD